jgi:hypothetical protein
VYQHLLENSGAGPAMQDSNNLFDDTNHANVTDQFSTLDVTSLSAARVLLRRQTAVGGGLLNLNPAYLLVRPEDETKAKMLLASGTRQRSGTVTEGIDASTPEWIGRLILFASALLDLPTGATVACMFGLALVLWYGLFRVRREGRGAAPSSNSVESALTDRGAS